MRTMRMRISMAGKRPVGWPALWVCDPAARPFQKRALEEPHQTPRPMTPRIKHAKWLHPKGKIIVSICLISCWTCLNLFFEAIFGGFLHIFPTSSGLFRGLAPGSPRSSILPDHHCSGANHFWCSRCGAPLGKALPAAQGAPANGYESKP